MTLSSKPVVQEKCCGGKSREEGLETRRAGRAGESVCVYIWYLLVQLGCAWDWIVEHEFDCAVQALNSFARCSTCAALGDKKLKGSNALARLYSAAKGEHTSSFVG